MDITYYKKRYEPVDGKWYINKEIGRGSYGTVFEIERKDFHEKCALKIVTIPSSPHEVESYKQEHPTHDDKSITSYFYGFVEEFVQEFVIMSKLKGNSNIVSIEDYDVKKHNTGIGWDILIRMELLTPMNKYFANNPMRTQNVIKLGIDICKALEECKDHNIIHRDIKPSNIFISKRGDFKLGDFGVARTLEKTSSGLSKKGTYTYMAPEVYKGEEYGSNVDIYSLGIVMYKLLNNNNEPFRTSMAYQDEQKALIRRLKGESIPQPINADETLSRVILKACSYDPKDRYSDPSEMRRDLEKIVSDDLGALGCISGTKEEVLYETEGILEKDEKHHGQQRGSAEKTVGLFDPQEKTVVDVSANNQQWRDNQSGKTKEQAEKKDKWRNKSSMKWLFAAAGLIVIIVAFALVSFSLNRLSSNKNPLIKKTDIPPKRTYTIKVENDETDGSTGLKFNLPSEIGGYIGAYENDFDGDGKSEELYIKLIENGYEKVIYTEAEMYKDGVKIDEYLLLKSSFDPSNEHEIYISFKKLQNRNVIFAEDNYNATIANGNGLTFKSVYYENNRFYKYHSYDFVGSDAAEEEIERGTNDFRNKGFNIKGLNVFSGNKCGTITQQMNAYAICSIEIKCTDLKSMIENYKKPVPFTLTLRSNTK